MGLREDIVGWDVANWSRALDYWESTPDLDLAGCHALELGCGGNGGLSLWLATRGCKVTCSGYQGVEEAARTAHRAYGVEHLIRYDTIDACAIPFRETFDLVCYKSVLGRIVQDGPLQVGRDVVAQIMQALKPGGRLLFAENLASTRLHHALRQRWGTGKNRWRYFTVDELVELHSGFTSFEYTTFGFTGCLGRTERQRRLLGRLDRCVLDGLVPDRWRYIMAGIATKQGVSGPTKQAGRDLVTIV
jgi:SAM-dependent methyltransferase